MSFLTPNTIRRCAAGHTEAQREVYEALQRVMFGVVLRYAGSREEARDWLHDGFIRLFDRMGGYRFEGSFEGWARRVFVSTALDHLRQKRLIWSDLDSGPIEAVDWSVAADGIDRIDADRLIELIGALPPPQRTVLNLFSIEGYAHEEVAEELGISVENSRITLHRAKQTLEQRLKKEGILPSR